MRAALAVAIAATALPVAATRAGAVESRVESALAALAAELDPRAASALASIDGTGRRLLAARGYLRGSAPLAERWSWSAAEAAAFEASPEKHALDAAIARVRCRFEAANPGSTLWVNPEFRSLDLQVERWNENETVGRAGENLLAAARRLLSSPDPVGVVTAAGSGRSSQTAARSPAGAGSDPGGTRPLAAWAHARHRFPGGIFGPHRGRHGQRGHRVGVDRCRAGRRGCRPRSSPPMSDSTGRSRRPTSPGTTISARKQGRVTPAMAGLPTRSLSAGRAPPSIPTAAVARGSRGSSTASVASTRTTIAGRSRRSAHPVRGSWSSGWRPACTGRTGPVDPSRATTPASCCTARCTARASRRAPSRSRPVTACASSIAASATR